MKNTTRQYWYVDYLWNKMKARSLGRSQVDIFPCQSNICRADLRSCSYDYDSIYCKNNEKDPLTNEDYFQFFSQFFRKEQLSTSDSSLASLASAFINSEITLAPKLLQKNNALNAVS